MACGSSEEILRTLGRPLPPNTELDISLIDQDKEALSFCNRRMLRLEATTGIPVGAKVTYFNTAVKTLVTRPEELERMLGQFDVLRGRGRRDREPVR